jgi:hypothetical protein
LRRPGVEAGQPDQQEAALVDAAKKTCTKCGGTRFNFWDRCMDCRNARGRSARAGQDGRGSHTEAEWQARLTRTPYCPDCQRAWADIPRRPDPRYRHVWTKGHVLPVYHGGKDDIGNVRPLCYQCNFRKNAGSLGGLAPGGERPLQVADESPGAERLHELGDRRAPTSGRSDTLHRTRG